MVTGNAALATYASPGSHRCWERELVETVAYRAAERGWPDDGALEQLCVDVLAGREDEQLVFEAVSYDPDLQDFCAADQPYRVRAEVRS